MDLQDDNEARMGEVSYGAPWKAAGKGMLHLLQGAAGAYMTHREQA